jgi:16S rRNA U516 pseudouridylate synthase RsuA-like enzyme
LYEHFDYAVTKLQRAHIVNLTLGDLKPEEVQELLGESR